MVQSYNGGPEWVGGWVAAYIDVYSDLRKIWGRFFTHIINMGVVF